MNEIPDLLLIYLSCMNLLAFVAFGRDKAAARKGQRRIPEKTLFNIALLGGSLGALIGMHVFRHKTRHSAFRWGIPLFLIAHAVIIWLLNH